MYRCTNFEDIKLFEFGPLTLPGRNKTNKYNCGLYSDFHIYTDVAGYLIKLIKVYQRFILISLIYSWWPIVRQEKLGQRWKRWEEEKEGVRCTIWSGEVRSNVAESRLV